jgi:hypothetical protein
MEVCSSTEMGAPGASHLGTEDHGPKTHRSKPRLVLVNGHPLGCVVAYGEKLISAAVRAVGRLSGTEENGDIGKYR